LSGVRAGTGLAGANRRVEGERAMAGVKVRGSRCRCQASDDVYGEQIEHERKETDEFLSSPMSPLLLAGTITFEHDGVAPQRVGTVYRRGSGLCSRRGLK